MHAVQYIVETKRKAILEIAELQAKLREAVQRELDRKKPLHFPLSSLWHQGANEFMTGGRALLTGNVLRELAVYANQPEIEARLAILRALIVSGKTVDGKLSSLCSQTANVISLVIDLRNFCYQQKLLDARMIAIASTLATDADTGDYSEAMQEAVMDALAGNASGMRKLDDVDLNLALQGAIEQPIDKFVSRLRADPRWLKSQTAFKKVYESALELTEPKNMASVAIVLDIQRGSLSYMLRDDGIKSNVSASVEQFDKLAERLRAYVATKESRVVSTPRRVAGENAPRALPPNPPRPAAAPRPIPAAPASAPVAPAASPEATNAVPSEAQAEEAAKMEEVVVQLCAMQAKTIKQLRTRLGRPLSPRSRDIVTFAIHDLIAAGGLTVADITKIVNGPTAEEQRQGAKFIGRMLGGAND